MISKACDYSLPEIPLNFLYLKKQPFTVTIGRLCLFTIYYDDAEYSVRLRKGGCVEILNGAQENSIVYFYPFDGNRSADCLCLRY